MARIRTFLLALSFAAVASLAAATDYQVNVVPALNQVKGAFYTFGAPVEKGGHRYLFVGNSITLHGPKPSIGWTNRCGMAASSLEKDYVHVCANLLAQDEPNASFALAQVAGSVERAFTNADWSVARHFGPVRAYQPDVIVLFFGANVPKAYDANPSASVRPFASALGEMLDYIDPDHRALTLVSEGFYIRPVLDAEKRALAVSRGARYVKMEDIRARPETHGRFNHPNDLGMEQIARRFADEIREGLAARTADGVVWKGGDLKAWTSCTNSIRSFELTDEGLVARMSNWRDACLEMVFATPRPVGPEWELVFRAKATCPDSGRIAPVGLVKPLYAGMGDYCDAQSQRFLWNVSGAWKEYAVRPFADANGRALGKIKLRLPPEGYSSGVVTISEIALRRGVQPASLDVLVAEADGFARAGEPFEVRVRVWNRGTADARAVKLTACGLPTGVSVIDASRGACGTVWADTRETLRLRCVAARTGGYDLPFVLSGEGILPRRVTVRVGVAAKPQPAKAAYVPEPQPAKTDYEIAACYYPGWTTRERWNRVSRVCPERQPLLGWYDEANPEAIDWQIKWFVEHGIGVMMLDWYWRGHLLVDHYFQAFQKARYKNYMKWMVMWCNESPKKGGHSPEDNRNVTRHWIDNYFKLPEYYRIDGKPVVGIFVPEHYVRDFGVEGTKKALAEMRQMVVAAGYKGLHLIGFVRPEDDVGARQQKYVRDLGFDEIARYNCRGAELTEGRDDCYPWADTVDFNLKSWDLYARAGVPFWPLASSGWDDRPWIHGRETYGRNARDFRRLLKGLKDFADRTGRTRVMIGPINEWGEGSFIEPNRQFGFGMYEAIRDTFCIRPAEGWPRACIPADVGLGPYDLPAGEADPAAGEPMDLTDARTHGWKELAGHTREVTPTSAGLRVVPRSATPAIVCDYLPFAAADFSRLVVRMKFEKPVARGHFKIYWKIDGRPWVETASASRPLDKSGAVRDYVFDLGAAKGWSHRITALRLQPSGTDLPPYVVESVRFEK